MTTTENTRTNENEITLETLAQEYMRATGCSRDHASDVLAAICTHWHCTSDDLPRRISALAAVGLPHFHLLLWLAVTPCLTEVAAGREAIFFAALQVATRHGITRELLQRLQAEPVQPPPWERRH